MSLDPTSSDPVAPAAAPPVPTANEQLTTLVRDQFSSASTAAFRAAGQQVGALAQAVRQAGEELRLGGRPGQGRTADQIAQPLQKLSGSLSHADPVPADFAPSAIRAALDEQVQRARADLGARVDGAVTARTAQASGGLAAAADGARRTSAQLRLQGQPVAALVLEAVVERVEPLQAYLDSSSPDRLRGDAIASATRARSAAGSVAEAATRRRSAATRQGAQLLQRTGSAVRRAPLLPVAGALVGVVVAGRLAARPEPATPTDIVTTVGDPVEPPPATEDLSALSKSELRERASSAGLPFKSKMGKQQLRDLIASAS